MRKTYKAIMLNEYLVQKGPSHSCFREPRMHIGSVKLVGMWVLLLGEYCPYTCLQEKGHACFMKNPWISICDYERFKKVDSWKKERKCLLATQNLAESLLYSSSLLSSGKTCPTNHKMALGRCISQQGWETTILLFTKLPFLSKVFI